MRLVRGPAICLALTVGPCGKAMGARKFGVEVDSLVETPLGLVAAHLTPNDEVSGRRQVYLNPARRHR